LFGSHAAGDFSRSLEAARRVIERFDRAGPSYWPQSLSLLASIAKALACLRNPVAGSGVPVTPFIGQILNLSASGLMLESDAPLDINHEVSISFFVPGTQTRATAAACVVRRVNGDGVPRWGLRFAVLEPAVRQAVNLYVAGQRTDVKPR
jgi:hypothetical protein